MNLCWLTDIHLNFLSEKNRFVFYRQIRQTKSDVIIISGDIADAISLNLILTEMADNLGKPICFVLGNHDYYHGEIKKVRNEIRRLCAKRVLLYWLPSQKFVRINKRTLLVGQDGWADGRCGDYKKSRVVLNDSVLIYDLAQKVLQGKNQLLAKMQELADIDAKALHHNLMKNINADIKKIIILTHVPPFSGACWHEKNISAWDWLPFFTSKIMGDVILSAAQDNPFVDFLVLCGHTHSNGIYCPLPNLSVKTGKAQYDNPQIQKIITI